jgi:hypothetical protein
MVARRHKRRKGKKEKRKMEWADWVAAAGASFWPKAMF